MLCSSALCASEVEIQIDLTKPQILVGSDTVINLTALNGDTEINGKRVYDGKLINPWITGNSVIPFRKDDKLLFYKSNTNTSIEPTNATKINWNEINDNDTPTTIVFFTNPFAAFNGSTTMQRNFNMHGTDIIYCSQDNIDASIRYNFPGGNKFTLTDKTGNTSLLAMDLNIYFTTSNITGQTLDQVLAALQNYLATQNKVVNQVISNNISGTFYNSSPATATAYAIAAANASAYAIAAASFVHGSVTATSGGGAGL